MSDDYIVGLLARARPDGLGIGDGDTNNTRTDKLVAGGVLMEEIGIRAQDFWDFLPKSESISWLILYKSKFSFFLYAIISSFVYFVGSFSSNAL